MTIVIAGSIRVPREKRDYLLKAGRQFTLDSRAEPGCIHYDWSADPADPEIMHVFEEWADEASLQAHFSANAYLDTLQLFADTCEIEADVRKYRVDRVEPVYDETGKPRADFFTEL